MAARCFLSADGSASMSDDSAPMTGNDDAWRVSSVDGNDDACRWKTALACFAGVCCSTL